jgi:hypothetical protein
MGLRYQYRARTDHSRGMGFCHPAMFAHREIYQQLGEYDTRYRLAADYDFVLRALDQNVSFIPIDVFLVNYRNTGLSARNLARSLGEIKTINKKHFGVFSFAHGRFITSYIKTLLLISLQPIIKSIAGDKFLTKLKLLYTRIFLSKNREV